MSPPPQSKTKLPQHHTLHQRETPARLSSRKSSRSASQVRRSQSRSETPAPTWYLEPNPQGNGGLYNAIASVSGTLLKRKLWVGTLGTATDGFDAHVRKGVDARLREECDSFNVWIGTWKLIWRFMVYYPSRTDDDEFAGYYDVFCHQVSGAATDAIQSHPSDIGTLAMSALCYPGRTKNQSVL